MSRHFGSVFDLHHLLISLWWCLPGQAAEKRPACPRCIWSGHSQKATKVLSKQKNSKLWIQEKSEVTVRSQNQEHR